MMNTNVALLLMFHEIMSFRIFMSFYFIFFCVHLFSRFQVNYRISFIVVSFSCRFNEVNAVSELLSF